jgi:hypothetical protein
LSAAPDEKALFALTVTKTWLEPRLILYNCQPDRIPTMFRNLTLDW